MENTQAKKNESERQENPANGFDPTNRDFQRTEEDIDDISKSEKEELERRKQRTHEGSTKPDKDHVGG